MKNKTKYWWVRIHSSSVRTDEDSEKLTHLMMNYGASFNTQNSRNMWFDFPSKLQAIGFVNNITEKLPYLKITLGN